MIVSSVHAPGSRPNRGDGWYPVTLGKVPGVRNSTGEGGYPCYRIPALVVTPAGTLLAAYDGRPNPDDLPGPIDLLLRRSHDNGDTWEPQEILRTGDGFEGFGDPSFIIDHDQITAAVAFSDDQGATWALSAPIGVGTDESAVAALADGRLLMHSRSVGHRLASYSEDGGATWSTPQPINGLPDPSDNGSLIVLGQAADECGPRAALLASSNLDLSLRRNTALSISHDGGETWPHQLVLQPGSSAYSCAAQLPNGRIGVLYEKDAYTRITFTSVDLAEIEESGPADPVQAGIARGRHPTVQCARADARGRRGERSRPRAPRRGHRTLRHPTGRSSDLLLAPLHRYRRGRRGEPSLSAIPGARARTIARPHLHFSERVTQNARGLEFAGHVIFAQR